MGSNKPKPITFAKSHQDLDKSVSKPMAEYDPDHLIGRTFLLPPNQKGERHRASIKQKVIEILSQELDKDQNTMVDNINFLLDVGQGRLQAIISYNQVLNNLDKENQDDRSSKTPWSLMCIPCEPPSSLSILWKTISDIREL